MAVPVGPAAVTVIDYGGTDRVTVTLPGGPSAVSPIDASRYAVTVAVEAVTFTATGTAATAWALDAGRLTGGGVKLLDAGTATLSVSLGAGADAVTVNGVPAATTLDVGGGNAVSVGSLTTLRADLTLTAPGAGNSLTVDDTASAVGTPRSLSVTGGVLRSAVAPGVLAFDPTRFGTVTVNLGATNDAVTLRDLSPAGATTVNAGVGDDIVTTAGSVGTLAVNGDAGADALTVADGTGTVTFSGGANAPGAPDRATVDRSAAVTALTGSITAAGAFASVPVLGAPTLRLTADAETVTVLLGGGNDAFAIDTRNASGPNFSPQTLRIDGGAGDDAFTVVGVTGAADSVTLDGGLGRDTATVVIAGAPVANQFAPVVPNVERLVVDNAASAAPVAWAANGRAVSGNGVLVLDATGADRVEFRGGAASIDTMTVSGSDDARPLDVAITDTMVTVQEGLNVLAQSGNTLVPPATTTITTVLTGARAVAAAPYATAVVNGVTQTTSTGVRRRGQLALGVPPRQRQSANQRQPRLHQGRRRRRQLRPAGVARPPTGRPVTVRGLRERRLAGAPGRQLGVRRPHWGEYLPRLQCPQGRRLAGRPDARRHSGGVGLLLRRGRDVRRQPDASVPRAVPG